MREIKFRAWDKEVSRMDYIGTLDDIYSDGYQCCMSKSFSDLDVMQFTGLRDKNGKEIYEGDIIKYIEHWDSVGGINVEKIEAIEWFDSWEGDGNRLSGFVLPTRESNEVEVIGNLYKNPDLIKQS